MAELETGIDALYAGPLDAFVRERDALAKARAAAGDDEGASRVRALRKPVVSAWALNRLAREEPAAVGGLADLGDRLRAAQRRAVSGGDVAPLREAIEERRRVVRSLARTASKILETAGIAAATHTGDLTSTLEAATADEEAADLLRSGRLVRPLRPPSGFEERGLRVLEGGRQGRPQAEVSSSAEKVGGAKDAERARELRRGLEAAERRERAYAANVERARCRLEEVEGRRAQARESLKAAEAEHRGAALDAKRLSATLGKLGRRN
jgi:hypothetical protein